MRGRGRCGRRATAELVSLSVWAPRRTACRPASGSASRSHQCHGTSDTRKRASTSAGLRSPAHRGRRVDKAERRTFSRARPDPSVRALVALAASSPRPSSGQSLLLVTMLRPGIGQWSRAPARGQADADSVPERGCSCPAVDQQTRRALWASRGASKVPGASASRCWWGGLAIAIAVSGACLSARYSTDRA